MYSNFQRLAFYGNIKLFNYTSWYSDESMYDFIINGAKRNLNFAKRIYNLKLYPDDDNINSILICNNIGIKANSFVYFWSDFNYPSYDICKRYSEKYPLDVSLICILNGWKDLYNKCISLYPFRDNSTKSLAYYIGDKYFIESQNELEFDEGREEEVDYYDMFFYYYSAANFEDKDTNLYPHNVNKYINTFYEPIDELDFECLNHDDYDVTDASYDEIATNFSLACSLYNKGNTSNIVLSKIICTDRYIAEEIYSKYIPFLLFCRSDIYSGLTSLCKYNKLVIYNIIYINLIHPRTSPYSFLKSEYLEYCEYNIYVMAVKLKKKPIIEKMIELYNKHKILYKILDLENEKYIKEKIYQLPKIEDIPNIDFKKPIEIIPYKYK